MLRIPVRPLIALVALIAIACSIGPSEPVYSVELPKGIWSGSLSARPTADGIEVFNGTDVPDPYYFFAIERVTSTYTDWVPCTGGPTCPSVLPGERRMIPWSSVAGYAASKNEYIVSFWRVTRSPDGTLAATGMQNVVVTR